MIHKLKTDQISSVVQTTGWRERDRGRGRNGEGRRGMIDDELMDALRISCTARRRMQEITNFTLLTTVITSTVAADRSKDTRPQSSVFSLGNGLKGQASFFYLLGPKQFYLPCLFNQILFTPQGRRNTHLYDLHSLFAFHITVFYVIM